MPRGQYDRTASAVAEPEMTEALPPDDGPTREELLERLAEMEARLAAPRIDTESVPDGLIVPTPLTPIIDPTRAEDCPDLPDGEWSRDHLLQFLARQPRQLVFVNKEEWEPKGEDVYQVVGLQGHWFRVLKHKSVSVPVQIAAIIEQSQEDFPTTQSQARRRALTNILDMPAEPGSLGVPGVQTFLNR